MGLPSTHANPPLPTHISWVTNPYGWGYGWACWYPWVYPCHCLPKAEPEKDQPQQHLTSENDSESYQSQEPTKEDNFHPDLETPDDDSSFNPEYGRRKGARRPKRGRPRGIAHIKFANQETAVTTVDSAFRKPINLEKHDLHVKQATGIWDR